MKKIENFCVDCGLPCLGSGCPYRNVTVYYCDECRNDEVADYRIDGEDYCETHAKEYIEEAWNDLTLSEQAELLDISLESLD